MKKTISLILSLVFVITCCLTAGSIAVSAETGYDRGYNQTMAGTGKVVAEGLDISEHQAGIKLQDIKNAGFDYVILRAGVKLNAGSNRRDYNFEDFYKQARAAGLDIGAYYYSQAKSVAEAKEEAKCFLEYIKGKKFEYPLYLDFESSAVRTLSVQAQAKQPRSATPLWILCVTRAISLGFTAMLPGLTRDTAAGWRQSLITT